MKRIRKILIVFIIFIFISCGKLVVRADSGFDSSWDSGSSFDSSSSWDSSSSSNYNSSNGSSSSGGTASIGEILLFFGFSIGATILIVKINKIPKSFRREKPVILKTTLSDEELMDTMGNDFNVTSFYNQIYENYKEIQIAWMKRDIDSVRHLLSDEMFNMYKMQISTLELKKQINVMEDFKCIRVAVISVNRDYDKEVINVYLEVECRDYLIQEDTEKVIRGDSEAINNYSYHLSFIRTVNCNYDKKCPNCGAPIDNTASIKCEYCNSVIIQDSSSYVMTSKKIVKQRIKEHRKKAKNENGIR